MIEGEKEIIQLTKDFELGNLPEYMYANFINRLISYSESLARNSRQPLDEKELSVISWAFHKFFRYHDEDLVCRKIWTAISEVNEEIYADAIKTAFNTIVSERNKSEE